MARPEPSSSASTTTLPAGEGPLTSHEEPAPPSACLVSRLPEIRTASEEDREALRGMFVRAFDSDPLTNWYVRDDGQRTDAMHRVFDWYLSYALPLGSSHTTAQRAAAALWIGPGQWDLSLERHLGLLREAVRVVGWRRLITRALGTEMIQRKHPGEPHFYLAVLGTDPNLQGKGLGSHVLKAGLNRCDRSGVPAYLETSNPRNVPLYERHGFRVLEGVELLRGPRIWLMWREPRKPPSKPDE